MRRYKTVRNAIVDEALPGAKAGNTVIDDFYEIFAGAKSLAAELARHCALDTEYILRKKERNIQHIESTLDSLLDAMMHGEGERVFKRLLDYYKGISSSGYSFYKQEYDRLCAEFTSPQYNALDSTPSGLLQK